MLTVTPTRDALKSGTARLLLTFLLGLSTNGLAQDGEEPGATEPRAESAPAETIPAAESAPEPAQEAPVPGPDATATPGPTSETPAPPEPAADTAAAEATPEAELQASPEALSVIPVQELRPPEQPDIAADRSGPAQLDEVIVTAQKRVQSVQTVPISMSVMNDTFIRAQGITDIADALLFVPNFRVVQTSFSITPQCRGFVVEFANAAFEPPCGVAVDGIGYTRGYYFASALFDTDRIEVLRGPQGTTFGKNTTAGVVSLQSKDPTDAFTSNIDLQYGPDGRKRAEAGVGGTLIPDFAEFRLAGLFEDRRGLVRNTTGAVMPEAGEYGGGRERMGLRAKVLFPDLFGTQLKLTYEEAESEFAGTNNELVLEEDGKDRDLAAYFRQYDPDADFTPGNWVNSVAGPSSGTVTTERMQLDWTASLGGWDLTAVGAAGDLIQSSTLEVIAAPSRIIFSTFGEKNPMTTGELRALSPQLPGLLGMDDLFGADLGYTTLLLGTFYQDQQLKDHFIDVSLCQDILAAVIVAQQNRGVVPPRTNCIAEATGHMRFHQQVTTAALFGQLTWNLTERWMVELGGRYTDEKKDGHWNAFYSPPPNLLDLLGNKAYTADREIHEPGFQPKISLGYSPNSDLNFFVHWARGFKSGGFNAYAIAGNPEDPSRPPERRGSLTYGPETGTEWGIDAKTTLLDKRLRLNVSLYRLDLDNFQILTTVLGTEVPASTVRLTDGYDEVINSGQARAQGVEADITFLMTEWLTVIGAVGYNDTEFLSFPNAVCAWDRGTEDNPDFNPDTGRCDAAGKSMPYAPEWNNSITLHSTLPLGKLWGALDGLDFLIGGTTEYVSEYFLSAVLDERVKQDGFYRYRAHVGLANQGQGWNFRITGLNLSNEYALSRQTWDGTFKVGIPEDPRTVYGQFSWSF